MLNMLVYACISLNKLSAENVRILNMSDAVIGIRSLYKLMSSYQDRALYSVFRALSHIYDGAFCKKKKKKYACKQNFFKAGAVS